MADEQVQAPQNLTELALRLKELCEQGRADSRWIGICLQWEERTRRVYQENAADLAGVIGRLGQLWVEQGEIYQEILEHLAAMATMLERQKWPSLQGLVCSFQGLLAELLEFNELMQAWRTSDVPRCLRCGFDEIERSAVCPHCDVTLLRPIRRMRGQVNSFARLAGPQLALFQSLQAVLAGRMDIQEVYHHLQPLQREYDNCQKELSCDTVGLTDELCEAAVEMLRAVPEACAGLAQIHLAVTELDAQHIEDGWLRFFQAEQSLRQLLPQFVVTPGSGGAEADRSDQVVLRQVA